MDAMKADERAMAILASHDIEKTTREMQIFQSSFAPLQAMWQKFEQSSLFSST
jgi:hypothetical protein